MHRQGQGAPPLRVRRQGQRRHHALSLTRRPVRHPCRGCLATPTTATPSPRSVRRSRRSLAMSSIASSSMPAIAATMRRPNPSSRSLPQARSAASRRRSNADATARRRRAGHRPSQGRAPHGPQPSRPFHRRCHQRRAGRPAGYNFRLLIRWLRLLWLMILIVLVPPLKPQVA